MEGLGRRLKTGDLRAIELVLRDDLLITEATKEMRAYSLTPEYKRPHIRVGAAVTS